MGIVYKFSVRFAALLVLFRGVLDNILVWLREKTPTVPHMEVLGCAHASGLGAESGYFSRKVMIFAE
jgi:hypothetical protein